MFHAGSRATSEKVIQFVIGIMINNYMLHFVQIVDICYNFLMLGTEAAPRKESVAAAS